jgi:hypothetical protein
LNTHQVKSQEEFMSDWVHGNQVMPLVQFTESDLIQESISQHLTPHNDQGQPIRPVDVVMQHIAGLEQELSQLDAAAWDMTGLEREKIIANRMQPLEERLQRCRSYMQAIENSNWNEFELPQDHDLAACIVDGLANSHYRADEVDRLLPGHTESPEERKPPAVKSKIARSVHSQEHIQKCRKIAMQVWDQEPDLTIAGMINRSEMIRQAMRPDGTPYSEMTVRAWIRDLCPNRKPGRRPAQK